MQKATDLHGAGIGLRSQHYQHILEHTPAIPWFEALTDNYMGAGGLPLYFLERINELYPLSFHGVGLSLASCDPLNKDYLTRLKNLVDRFNPAHVSDHLSWVSSNNHYLHELMPFPYTQQALQLVSDKVSQVQDILGRQLLVENPSSYMEFDVTQMSEWVFLEQLVDRTNCGILLDVNNLYVSAHNTDLCIPDYLNDLPQHAVREIHLAGHENRGTHLYDTHGYPIQEPVWALYEQALTQFPDTPTLIEWDNDIPEFQILEQEARTAQNFINQNTQRRHSA